MAGASEWRDRVAGVLEKLSGNATQPEDEASRSRSREAEGEKGEEVVMRKMTFKTAPVKDEGEGEGEEKGRKKGKGKKAAKARAAKAKAEEDEDEEEEGEEEGTRDKGGKTKAEEEEEEEEEKAAKVVSKAKKPVVGKKTAAPSNVGKPRLKAGEISDNFVALNLKRKGTTRYRKVKTSKQIQR